MLQGHIVLYFSTKAINNNKAPRNRQQMFTIKTSSVSVIILSNGFEGFNLGNCTKETVGHNTCSPEGSSVLFTSYASLRNTLASSNALF